MRVSHHGIEVELLDSWWSEANMEGFVPLSRAFRIDSNVFKVQDVFEVHIPEISPVIRAPSIGVFNNNHKATAQERVVNILCALRSNTPLPPVQVVAESNGSVFRYKLTAGFHRLYCSIACGFTHIPAVVGIDTHAERDKMGWSWRKS